MVSQNISSRGRASSAIRPGILIKYVLMGQVPLIVGGKEQTVTEASIADLYSTYREYVNRENQLRKKDKKISHMVYNSFVHFFKYARYLGLVELVRQEDMLFPPEGGNLYRIEKTGDKVTGVISKRRIFRLTQLGYEEDRAWTNLCTAYKEQWTMPVKQELPIPVISERRRIPVISWADTPSVVQYNKMLDYLRLLNTMDTTSQEVKQAVIELKNPLADWSVELSYRKDMAEQRGRKAQAQAYIPQIEKLDAAVDAAERADINTIISKLSELTAR